MVDFMRVSTRTPKKGVLEVYPNFILKKSSDLMIRGGDFYAIWLEDQKCWSTDEQDVISLVDSAVDEYVKNLKNDGSSLKVCYMWDSKSRIIDDWHHYCQKQMRDNFHPLDEKLIFSNTEVSKKDYSSKRLPYPLEEGSIEAYDKLMSVLYSEEERHKLEWAIGSIVEGDSKKIQKFMVLYGSAGTGKSTVLSIIEKLFEGYCETFDAKALGSSSNLFALEAFHSNPLVAIQHDGDLSRIDDNTRLNSLVSHEVMPINEKYRSTYSARINSFLFIGTNRPVKITDGKSGLLRRLIDVSPTGNKVGVREYKKLTKQIDFELGAIAYHCWNVYLDDPGRYDDYIPKSMMGASNDFYNYVIDSYSVFKRQDGVTLKSAWEMYKQYIDEAKVSYPFSKRIFKEELKNYFWEFDDQFDTEDGNSVKSYYHGFRTDIFETEKKPKKKKEEKSKDTWIDLKQQHSLLDDMCAEYPAQYATDKETPSYKWDDCKTYLKDLDSSKLHYVRIPENHIVIDFDIKDENGNKSFEKNLEAANKWPATYAEVSKGGAGIHLHYIYNGDPKQLSRIYDKDIEVKVFSGKSSLRRRLSLCNDILVAVISSGLPLVKRGIKMINGELVKSEKSLRTLIKRNLEKEIHPGTKPSIDFIYKILDDAYNQGLKYDVSDMFDSVLAFAINSSHHSDYCVKLVNQMKFSSDEPSDILPDEEKPIVFYDVEVFPNLFLINWKFQGKDVPVVRMINPTPQEVEDLLQYRLVGFNCRRYDNHILYARVMGYTNEQLYNLSQKIVSGDKNAFFREAYNLSYTDVYDFCVEKRSLKKWEIKLGIHHQELGLPWDQPVDEKLWTKVAEYCDNDVIATEAVFDARQADFTARKIQVDLVKILHDISNVSVNDTTNTLSQKIIFGANHKPQAAFNYRDLSKPIGSDRYEEYREKFGPNYIFRVFNEEGIPEYRDYIPGEKLPDGWSILPFFKGYIFDHGKSTYLGEEIGEGGRVYAEPGMYGNVWDGDVASQHPHSMIFEVLFGPEATARFQDIVSARIAIKHKDFDAAKNLLGGALAPYLNKEQASGLAQALKIVINSIYGLTSAAFDNPFRDIRNKDNIVAKRGSLFMTLLKKEVQKRGYKVAHIKTDSIKIPDADDNIKEFVIKFGKEFGYSFETEAVFEKFCIVNDAVFIAKIKDGEWTATGTQFAVPYVFKTLFTHEDVLFDDLCETFSVSKGDLYLDMNESLPDVSVYEKTLTKLKSDYKKGKITDDIFESESKRLNEKIAEGHHYIFVGRVGQFTPILPGNNAGALYRINEGKPYAASGSTGYRWLESEVVSRMDNKNDIIDYSFYDKQVNDAIDTISKFGDFEWFASDSPYISEDFMNIPEDSPDEVPWY